MAVWGLGALGTRLAVAFVGVALTGIAVLASIILVTERADVAGLAATGHARTSAAVVSALENGYRANGRWPGSDLQPAVVLTQAASAALALEAPDGTVLLRSGPQTLLNARGAAKLRKSLLIGGQEVAILDLAFPADGLSPADLRLRSTLVKAVAVSAGLAALVALVLAVIAAQLLVRPIRRLSAATRALGMGRQGTRVGDGAGPGELGQLGRAFDVMATALEHQVRLRQAMVADVAHELRTPLAVLQAETEALVDGLRDPTPEALASLHEESLRLGRLVADLQTLASAEVAGLSLQCHLVDLATVTAAVADSLASQFRAADLELDQNLSTALVWADPHRLGQIVTNLLLNAAKFTPSGGRMNLTVRVERDDAYMAVADSGPGIAAEERELVFERFFRGNAGRKSAGTGIGLAVVRELVEAHGGTVRLGDSPLGGACFVVRLPVAKGPSPAR